MAKRGRRPRVTEAERAVLIEIVRENPTATLGEIQIAWEQRSGLKAHPQTLQKALRAAGIEKRLKSPVVRVEASAPGESRYGYTEAHRRQAPEQTYPSFLTDAEWALVEDLFTVSANAQGFVVLAKRWVVEHTHAWNERARRLITHHDRLTSVSEAWVWLTEARMLLRRLTT